MYDINYKLPWLGIIIIIPKSLHTHDMLNDHTKNVHDVHFISVIRKDEL